MKCKECQQHLYEYRDQSLERFWLDEIRTHINHCPACREIFGQEEELAREFQQMGASLQARLQFQFQAPPLSGIKQVTPKTRPMALGLKWALATALGLLLIVFAKFLLYPPAERQTEPGPTVAMQNGTGGGQQRTGRNGTEGNGLIQVISIEDETGAWSETHFRQETAGLISDITVEVNAIRVLNRHPADDKAVSR
jgi:hypothetical protein